MDRQTFAENMWKSLLLVELYEGKIVWCLCTAIRKNQNGSQY